MIFQIGAKTANPVIRREGIAACIDIFSRIALRGTGGCGCTKLQSAVQIAVTSGFGDLAIHTVIAIRPHTLRNKRCITGCTDFGQFANLAGSNRVELAVKGINPKPIPNPPKELAGKKILAVRDYLAGTRTAADGTVTPAGLPKSDVLYFELEKGDWVCIRPSGTEPKIKLYVNTNEPEEAAAHAENDKLVEASKKLMA